jgi:hypothetical protein
MAALGGVIDRHEVVTENAPRDRQRSLAYPACKGQARQSREVQQQAQHEPDPKKSWSDGCVQTRA